MDNRRALLESLARQRPGSRTALDWLHGALGRLPGRPVLVHKLWLLRFDGAPQVPGGLLRGAESVREGTVADAEGMSRCEGKSAGVFLGRFAEGDHCVVAEVLGGIVGYEWFSIATYHQEQHYGFRIDIPVGCVYAYDGFIIPEHRLTGAWLKFQDYLGAWMKPRGMTAVITAIEASNRASLITHLRFGFRPYAQVLVVTVLGRRFSFQRPA